MSTYKHATWVASTATALAFTAFTALQAQAQAQVQNVFVPDWVAIPYASGMNPDSHYGVTTGNQHGYGGGLRLGKTFANDFEVQLNLGSARKKVAGTATEYEQTVAHLDVSYFFARRVWQPFVALGIGEERDRRKTATSDIHKNSPSLSAGAGVRYMFSPDWGLQLDYRRVEGFLKDSATFGSKRSGNNYLNLGLVIAFGDTKRPFPPAPAVFAPPPAPVAVVQAPPPPPVVAPPPPPPAPPARVTIDASRLFELNSARVAGDIPELNAYADAMKANPGITKVMVTGHTDQLGSASYNARLSQARAAAVKAYLVRKGVDARRLEAKGMASTQLVTQCKGARPEMIKCGQPNRRVELEQLSIERK